MARFTGGGSGGGSGAPGPRGPQGPQGPQGVPGEVTSEQLNLAIEDVTNYVNGFLDPSTGTIVEYVDQQDAATLLAANQYTDSVITGGPGGSGFNWRGEWSQEAANTYVTGDAVQFEGSSYIFVALAPTNNFPPIIAFPNPMEGLNPDWELLAAAGIAGEGFIFRGEWLSNPMDSPRPYGENDVVSYQGSTYVAKDNMNPAGVGIPGQTVPENGGTSGWKIMASQGANGTNGFTFRGEYDLSGATSYVQNDVVTLWNTTFFLPESSNYGQAPFSVWGILLEPWEILIPTAPNFRGDYDPAGAYYNGDVVSYNGGVYIVNPKGSLPVGYEYRVPDSDDPDNNWDVFVPAAEGFNWRGEWTSAPGPNGYAINDVVSYNGNSYVAVSSDAATTTAPDQNEGWDLVASKGLGFTFRGEYDSMTAYSAINDIVSYQGGLYVSDNLVGPAETPMDFMGVSPIDMMGNVSSAWEVFVPKAQSFVWKGTWSSMPMTPYVANDLVFHNGSSYLAAPDFMGAPAGSGTPGGSYTGWKLMASGLNWRGVYEQMPNPSYKLADIVSYNGSSYIAISDMVMGTPGDQSGSSSWALMAAAGEVPNWRGVWTEGLDPAPAINDVFSYNGSSYILTDLMGSMLAPDNGLGSTNSGWMLLAAGQGFNFLGPWQAEATYVKNDIVSYEGSTYILPTNNYNGAIPTDSNVWNLFTSKGDSLNWREDFNDTTIYYKNDIVSYNQNLYIAKEYLFYVSLPPTENPESWDLFLPSAAANIADFVFNYNEEDTDSTMTIHNHDMVIRTTRDDTQDADIEINSADDIWMTANDEIEITSTTDEVRIITGAFGQNTWNFRQDGLIGVDGDSGIEALGGGGVKGRLKFEPNNGRALLQAYSNSQTATFTDSWDTATWTTFDPQLSQLTLTNASSIISFMDATGYQVDNLKISVNGSDYGIYNGASSGDGAITFYIQNLLPIGEVSVTEVRFQYAFSSKVDIDFDEGDLLIETEDEMDIVISAADDLYLRANGDDVFIEANNDINFTANTDGSQQSWRMDINGKLQFPAAGYIENVPSGSGDGYGNDTFKIVPDDDLESDQYLIIDPTFPNHIHIRPGGEIDRSSAELYIGGERTHVVTDDGSHEVRISTGSTINFNSYLNINGESNSNFIAETGPVVVEVGYRVNVDGVDYIVDSVTPDTPAPGNVMISASGAVFNFGQAYTFRGDDGTNNNWSFGSDGTLYGPEEDQEIVVTGIVADSQTETFPIFSSGAMTLTANGGDMNFYMDGAAYIGPSVSENRIAQIKDLEDYTSPTMTQFSPVFQATGLTFTGVDGTYPTANSFYLRFGQLVTFNIAIDLSTVTNFGTGQFKVDLPFVPIATAANHFSAWAWVDPSQPADELNGHIQLVADHLPNSAVLDLHWLKETTATPKPVIESILSQGNPITFTTASKIYINGTYIAAV